MKEYFRCCFGNCKYKAESIIFILEHMRDKHKLRIGKELIKDLHLSESKSENQNE